MRVSNWANDRIGEISLYQDDLDCPLVMMGYTFPCQIIYIDVGKEGRRVRKKRFQIIAVCSQNIYLKKNIHNMYLILCYDDFLILWKVLWIL